MERRASKPIGYKHVLSALEGYIDRDCWHAVALFAAELLAHAGRDDLAAAIMDAVECGDRDAIKQLVDLAKWASRRKQRVYLPPR